MPRIIVGCRVCGGSGGGHMPTELPSVSTLQALVCIALTVLMGAVTWWKVRGKGRGHGGTGKDVFLAGGGLTWPFVAGSITLTNLATDQLVGMNGNQMLLLAWWEIAGFFGLMILAFVFVPVYYRNNCIEKELMSDIVNEAAQHLANRCCER